MKKLLCVLFVALLMLATVISPSAYDVVTFNAQYSDVRFFSDAEGAYVLGYRGKTAYIYTVAPGRYDITLDLSYNISSASVFGDRAVFLCDDIKNNQTVVYLYRISTDALDSYIIGGCGFRYHTGFAYAYGNVYLTDSADTRLLDIYSLSSAATDSCRFNDTISAVMSGYGEGVYVISGGTLYASYGGGFSAVSGSSLKPTAKFISEDLMSDASGNIYELYGNRIEKIFRAQSDGTPSTAGIYNGILYYPCGNTVYGYDVNTGAEKRCHTTDHPVSGVYAYKDYVVSYSASTPPSVGYLQYQDFSMTEIPQQDKNDTPADNPGKDRNADSDRARSDITSDKYQIDHRNYTISGIPSGTTFAVLKSNISYDGYDIALYRDTERKKSGQVGTAMTVKFSNNTDTYIYELSVTGDITGEGNVNSRDVNLLMDYLLDNAWLNGVYLLSADLSGDEKTDIKDLAMMKKM